MRLSKSLKDKLMDIRLRDKLLEQGKLTQQELDKYLKELKDDASEAAYTGQARQVADLDSPTTPTH